MFQLRITFKLSQSVAFFCLALIQTDDTSKLSGLTQKNTKLAIGNHFLSTLESKKGVERLVLNEFVLSIF